MTRLCAMARVSRQPLGAEVAERAGDRIDALDSSVESAALERGAATVIRVIPFNASIMCCDLVVSFVSVSCESLSVRFLIAQGHMPQIFICSQTVVPHVSFLKVCSCCTHTDRARVACECSRSRTAARSLTLARRERRGRSFTPMADTESQAPSAAEHEKIRAATEEVEAPAEAPAEALAKRR